MVVGECGGVVVCVRVCGGSVWLCPLNGPTHNNEK